MRVDPYVLELTTGLLLEECLAHNRTSVMVGFNHCISHCAWNIRMNAELLSSCVGSSTDKNFENNFTAVIEKDIKEASTCWALHGQSWREFWSGLTVTSEHIETDCSLTTVNAQRWNQPPFTLHLRFGHYVFLTSLHFKTSTAAERVVFLLCIFKDACVLLGERYMLPHFKNIAHT